MHGETKQYQRYAQSSHDSNRENCRKGDQAVRVKVDWSKRYIRATFILGLSLKENTLGPSAPIFPLSATIIWI